MISNDATILRIKHEVLYEVAKLAFAGTLEEKRERLPYEMIPGPQARFRCCIYKEREIIRQRIALAEGKAPSGKQSENVVQIIEAACEDCPISRYVVTDNCQKCMGKACQEACRFDAIEMGRDRAHINASKCRECGKCTQACPYNAIADLIRPCRRSCPVDAIKIHTETGLAYIDESRCINCGACIHRCPFGAISSKSSIVDVIRKITSKKRVVAMLAPATEGQFGEGITMQSWRTALKKAGFAEMVEVGLGADFTAASEAEEWLEAYEGGERKTTSCCPAFVSMVRKLYPELTEHISTTASPMCAASRLVKAQDPEAVTVFIGPCVAKKQEAREGREGTADYALTYGEIRAILRAKEIVLEPEENTVQQASIYGKRFASSGGVTKAVLRSMEEMGDCPDVKVMECNGAADCKKALMLLKMNRLPADFIEGMVCEGGCVGGPSSHAPQQKFRKERETQLLAADGRGIRENLSSYESIRMHG